jgi:hypothetical protein
MPLGLNKQVTMLHLSLCIVSTLVTISMVPLLVKLLFFYSIWLAREEHSSWNIPISVCYHAHLAIFVLSTQWPESYGVSK